MYGYFTKDGYVCGGTLDTDDSYRCSCGCQVLMASPSNLRSLEAQAQGKARLCSECISKKQEPETLFVRFSPDDAKWIPVLYWKSWKRS